MAKILATFRIDQELWDEFKVKCDGAGKSASSELIDFVLSSLGKQAPSSLSSIDIDKMIDNRLQTILDGMIDKYLSSNLDTVIDDRLESNLDSVIDRKINEYIQRLDSRIDGVEATNKELLGK